MKKVIFFVMVAALVLSLCGCAKKCENCGKSADEGYEIAEKFYCEDCLF